MTKLNVKTDIRCTEVNRKKCTESTSPALSVENHNIRSDEVILSILGVTVTVSADFLIRAVNNATNRPN